MEKEMKLASMFKLLWSFHRTPPPLPCSFFSFAAVPLQHRSQLHPLKQVSVSCSKVQDPYAVDVLTSL